MNVYRGYNDSRGEKKRNEKCGVSLIEIGAVGTSQLWTELSFEAREKFRLTQFVYVSHI